METRIRALTTALAALLGVLALPGAHGATSPNGVGRMSVSPTTVTAGSTVGEFTFTFIADRSSLKGVTTVDVPRGWTFPQRTNSTAAGHVELKRGTCGPATRISSIKSRRITIATSCGRRKSYQLVYRKATAPTISADGYIFLARTRPSGGGKKAKLKPLGRRKQPIVRVRGAAPTALFLGVTSVATVGVPFSVTVRGVDKYGNNAFPYAGRSAKLSSTDPHATLPGSYTFVQTDAAQHIFTGVVLRTAGMQRITATDSSGLTIESAPIAVSPPTGSAAAYRPSAFAVSSATSSPLRS
jgi:hypothetical protein